MNQEHETKHKHHHKHHPHRCDAGPPPVIGPGHDKGWEERLQNELVSLAERLRQGDNSVLGRMLRALPTATSERALEPPLAGCGGDFPYLVSLDDKGNPLYDRIFWWTQDGTTAGANVVPPPTGEIEKQFECEFNRPLVTIVGGNPSADPLPDGFDVLAWDGFRTPNEVPGLQFTVRVQHFLPEEQTILEIATVDAKTARDGQLLPRRVIRNGGVPNVPPDQFPEGKFRSSLVFEFHVPQRAVGLEFGYLPLAEGERQLSAVGVILYAYNEKGQLITSSDAGRVGKPIRQGDEPLLQPNFVQQRVGVRDANSNIRSVELRFESVHAHDPNGVRVVEEQVVYRVWHESLPPAVILQDRISREYGPEVGDPEIKSVTLPYRCDQALVLMRGFKLEFLDGRTHDFRSVTAFLETPDGNAPVYDAGIGGQIQFVVRGDPVDANEPFRRRVTADYTVLAWDSQQIDLFARPVNSVEQSSQGDLHSGVGFSRAMNPPLRLFGALQGFAFDFPHHQRLNQLWLAVGRFGSGPCHLDLTKEPPTTLGGIFGNDDNLLVIDYGSPGLASMPSAGSQGVIQIEWDICSRLHGGDRDEHTREVAGTILGGGSLGIPDYSGMANAGEQPRGPRPDPNDFFFRAPFAVGDGPTGPDMVVFGAEAFFMDVRDETQQLDIEIRAASHDGSTLLWGMGSGMTGNDGGTFAVPAVATLVRRARFQRGDLAIQNLFFDGVVGLVSEFGDNGIGAIRNIGDHVVLLSDLVTDTAQGRFEFRFMWQNNLHDVNGLLALLPLQLNPGDVLWVGGRYLPNAVAGDPTANPPIPPDQGTLTFRTNSPFQPTATVRAFGVAHASHPDGAWQIPGLDFANVQLNATKALLDVLKSTGQTPLAVNNLSLERPDTGFDFRLAPDSLDGLTVVVTYTERRPPPAGLEAARNRLLADTNAGSKPLPLIAGGLRIDPGPPIGG